jgi:HAD superfamily hydrolase (TIGR01509 family)
MLQAIVFDFDGVLCDSEPLHYRAILRIAEGLGVTFTYPQYLERYIGFDDRDAFRAILAQRDLPPAAAAAAPARPDDWHGDSACLADLVRRKGEAFAAIVAEGVPPIPGAAALAADAAGHLPLAIASGATARDIRLILAHLGLPARFDPIITADQVLRSKPDPQTYALAAQGLAQRLPGLTPNHILAIEDTAAGIAAARGAGLQVLATATTCPADQLRQAHRVVPTLEGLTVARLQQWFGLE